MLMPFIVLTSKFIPGNCNVLFSSSAMGNVMEVRWLKVTSRSNGRPVTIYPDTGSEKRLMEHMFMFNISKTKSNYVYYLSSLFGLRSPPKEHL